MSYSEIKILAERIKREFPILSYFQELVSSGFLKYEGLQGKEHFFGFLSQRTGSIAVNDRGNVWYDHSSGMGGDVIEAAQVFENLTFFQSIHRLSGSAPKGIISTIKKTQAAPKIEIESVRKISHPALINYIKSRGLEPDEIATFAKEVHWRNKGKSYFAVGFPNESAGWVLRSSIFKGNILGGGISIKILGKPERIKVFEGWFDFLSYLKLSDTTDFKAFILNSTANLSFRLMIDILKENKIVDLFLDNDAAGKKCTITFTKIAQLHLYTIQKGLPIDRDLWNSIGRKEKFESLISNLGIKPLELEEIWKKQTNVIDRRFYYYGFQDLNEFLNC